MVTNLSGTRNTESNSNLVMRLNEWAEEYTSKDKVNVRLGNGYAKISVDCGDMGVFYKIEFYDAIVGAGYVPMENGEPVSRGDFSDFLDTGRDFTAMELSEGAMKNVFRKYERH